MKNWNFHKAWGSAPASGAEEGSRGCSCTCGRLKNWSSCICTETAADSDQKPGYNVYRLWFVSEETGWGLEFLEIGHTKYYVNISFPLCTIYSWTVKNDIVILISSLTILEFQPWWWNNLPLFLPLLSFLSPCSSSLCQNNTTEWYDYNTQCVWSWAEMPTF